MDKDARTCQRELLVYQVLRRLITLGRRLEHEVLDDDAERKHDRTRGGKNAVDDDIREEYFVPHFD